MSYKHILFSISFSTVFRAY